MGVETNHFVAGALLTAGLLLGACQPMPTSGDPLAPVRVRSVQAPVEPADGERTARAVDPGSDDGGFDFEGEDRPADEGKAEEDPVALQARLLGRDPGQFERRAPPTAAPRTLPPAPMAPPTIPEWDPAEPLPGVSWGVRLLATLHDVQPPRAVLGMPDGTERVVKAGAMLPEHRVVVIAVGRDVVQLARVVPDGFAARVEAHTLQSLFPASARAPQP